MSDLEVRQLRYFVAVAEELHFGRAAERLGMAQPPLSRAIREVERQLGVQLFERTTRQVSLTPAGQELLRDARTALDAVSAATNRARNAGRPSPVLRVALKAEFDAGLLPRMINEYRQDANALPVEVLLGGRGEQVTALREGRADVAILPMPFDAAGIDSEPLLTEPRLVALASDDPLAARDVLCLADLDGRPLPDGFVGPQYSITGPSGASPVPPAAPPSTAPLLTAFPPAAPPSTAFPPAAPPSAAPPSAALPPATMDLAKIFSLVELGTLVWFPPASIVERHPRPGIAYRAVTDLAPSTLMVAWPHDSRSPVVAAFVRTAMTVAAEAYGSHLV